MIILQRHTGAPNICIVACQAGPGSVLFYAINWLASASWSYHVVPSQHPNLVKDSKNRWLSQSWIVNACVGQWGFFWRPHLPRKWQYIIRAGHGQHQVKKILSWYTNPGKTLKTIQTILYRKDFLSWKQFVVRSLCRLIPSGFSLMAASFFLFNFIAADTESALVDKVLDLMVSKLFKKPGSHLCKHSNYSRHAELWRIQGGFSMQCSIRSFTHGALLIEPKKLGLQDQCLVSIVCQPYCHQSVLEAPLL